MARRHGSGNNSTSTSFAEAAQHRDESKSIPPSTLAAQIVNNRTDDTQQHTSKATFGQLLDEIRTCPDNVETDTQTNAQLIRVVAEAGLDPLAKDDPFCKEAEAASQAIACLDVIRIVVDRNIDVLLHTPVGVEAGELPLILWLIPRLLNIVSCDESTETQKEIRRTIGHLLSTLGRSSVLWEQHRQLQALLRACANGLFLASTTLRPLTMQRHADHIGGFACQRD